MPTEIDVYIEHVISLSKDYSILFANNHKDIYKMKTSSK